MVVRGRGEERATDGIERRRYDAVAGRPVGRAGQEFATGHSWCCAVGADAAAAWSGGSVEGRVCGHDGEFWTDPDGFLGWVVLERSIIGGLGSRLHTEEKFVVVAVV